jgi:hypothetical protein
MHYCRLYLILYFLGQFIHSTVYSQDSLSVCYKAFLFESQEYAVVDTIMVCRNADNIPTGYKTNLDMAVCNDGLCARLVLKMYWDLAGGYMGYDTITGNPLTKFDHKRFSGKDYDKLNKILKDKNSILGSVEKEELIDKSIKIKATNVDAITGATSQSIKNAVVEGAVYSTYALWHLVFGSLIDSMRSYTLNIYSMQVARQLLNSDNYDSQLFAIRQMSNSNFETEFALLVRVIRRSIPLIKAYIINKAPLPFADKNQNTEFVSLFPELDTYSRSVFIDRITNDKIVAVIFLPLMIPNLDLLDSRQLYQCISAFQKFEIPVNQEYLSKLKK